jgi:hypothetical protein
MVSEVATSLYMMYTEPEGAHMRFKAIAVEVQDGILAEIRRRAAGKATYTEAPKMKTIYL